MKARTGRALAGLFLLGVSSGCATIFKGDRELVYFSSDPSEARVLVDGRDRGKTPIELKLDSERSHQVEIRKPGHRTARVRLNRVMGWGWMIFDAPTFFIGPIVDAISGDWYPLDMHRVHASLEKEPRAGP